ncbi:MAG: phospho-sugar mutase [Myxococcales bacterium]|nr:phospho-sugar mutase [Myxococcales bacterium]
MSFEPALRQRVEAYLQDEPDPGDRQELEALLAAGDAEALAERFARPLTFGTAGLRGPLGAGPSCINRATVARATAGLCRHVRESVTDAAARGLAIGYDGRHRSAELAEEVAAVAAGAGLRVIRFVQPVPTPLLAYCVREHGAAAGVMVTASHNPATDNGYKVYWEHGAQITAPIDTAILAAMDAVDSVRALPRLDAVARAEKGLEQIVGAELERRYLALLQGLVGNGCQGAPELTLAYTALHGVGERLVLAALQAAGFGRVFSVPEEAHPNPEFPGMPFPNPEEAGVMDRVLALGETQAVDLVLASDPDADRLAAAARGGAARLRMLDGNSIGALLADALLESYEGPATPLIVATIVSTPLCARIAVEHGARFEYTLTGFKWIEARARELEQDGDHRLVFGFEEALGYGVPGVSDKDGISAALLLACLAAREKAAGRGLLQRLEGLYLRHGLHKSRQLSLRLEASAAGRKKLEAMMQRLRAQPPERLSGLRVMALSDLKSGQQWGEPRLPLSLPPSDLLVFELEGEHRVCVRPSGTEAKLKCYLDVRLPLRERAELASVEGEAERLLDALTSELRSLLGADGVA